jgi:hypothetical protein
MTGRLCFVLMPYGKKPDGSGGVIDFDAVYEKLIKPAIVEAKLEPLRSDEEKAGGIIHEQMFERLVLCEFAVADLTTASANVFYELGVRHAARPWSTVPIFAGGGRLPFDVEPLRAVPYTLTPKGKPRLDAHRALVARLVEAKNAQRDSPIYSFLKWFPEPKIAREQTDLFRSQVRYSEEKKEQLAAARDQGKRGLGAVEEIERGLGPIAEAESGVVVDLFLSYRAVEGWAQMIELVGKMSPPLAATTVVQEQLALALNRAGDGAQAERVLQALIKNRGPSSETYGILGRVYKDRWLAARKNEDEAVLARGLLENAVSTYLKGFETDWRDAYPGINALTMMEVSEPPDPRREKLVPVVAYAVERRLASGKPDYWDHATALELAVVAKDEDGAGIALAAALAAVREDWEPKTTAGNLGLIREARAGRREKVKWADAAERLLLERAGAA